MLKWLLYKNYQFKRLQYITRKLQEYYNYIKSKKSIAKSKKIGYTKDEYIISYVQERKILKKSKKVLQNKCKMWYIIG